MLGPDSSYSSLEIHICWKVDNEDKMEPPIHTEYFLSGGAMILIFMVEGAGFYAVHFSKKRTIQLTQYVLCKVYMYIKYPTDKL